MSETYWSLINTSSLTSVCFTYICDITFFTLYTRVSQKNQKSKFWYATNPSGFHRLDEPRVWTAFCKNFSGTPHLTIFGAPKYVTKYANYGQKFIFGRVFGPKVTWEGEKKRNVFLGPTYWLFSLDGGGLGFLWMSFIPQKSFMLHDRCFLILELWIEASFMSWTEHKLRWTRVNFINLIIYI